MPDTRLLRFRRDLRTAIIAAAVAGAVAAAPALAAVIADYAKNSDKVDGKHAVSSSATASQRAYKLVATNSAGRLPNSIISKAPDADKVDGLHAVSSSASVSTRAKKLVAANTSGYLPNNIIQKASDADKLDGKDSTAFERTAIAGFKDGPVNVPGVIYGSMAKISLPAGKYVIFAKAWLSAGSAFTDTVTCRLFAGSDFDETKVRLQNSSNSSNVFQGSASLMVVHDFSSAGDADLQCKDVASTSTANFIKITALELDSFTNTAIP